jgi:putative membrane protein
MRARTLMILAACAALAVPLAAAGQDTKKDPVEPTPPPLGTASFEPPPVVHEVPLTANTFAIRAALAHMTEIELGELALARSKDPRVQAFARRMASDHRKSLEQLKRIVAEAKVALPGTLDEKHRKLKESLASLQGKEFDNAYAKAMAEGHDEAVALFDAAAHSDELPNAMRQYASSTLPTVREHRNAAHELHEAQAKAN